jgi:hypothetical protein
MAITPVKAIKAAEDSGQRILAGGMEEDDQSGTGESQDSGDGMPGYQIRNERRQQQKPARLDDGRWNFPPFPGVNQPQERPEPNLDKSQDERQAEKLDRILDRIDKHKLADGKTEPSPDERAEDDIGDAEKEHEPRE